MKKTITIFVSGAKRLKEHRMRLKVLANDMNGELRRKGVNITINMYSYMNLGDDQKEYDDFIREKSDIVLFIIEDKLGDKTREEFLLASESFKKTGSPKMYVFLKEFYERTPQITDIENLINAESNSYYIEYSNLEDLETKVKDRLQHDINERMEQQHATPQKKARKFKFMAAAFACAFFALLGIYAYSAISRANDVILLFVGGGSAANCLKMNYETVGDVYKYEDAISIGVPTSSAWALVTAEILHHHAMKSDMVQVPFYPICMSAKKAKETDFLRLCDRDEFIKKGSVLKVHIGDDRLMVYVKKTMDHELVNGKDSITANELAQLIKLAIEQQYTVFCTQEGSGTLLSYRDLLIPHEIDLTPKSMNNLEWFSQQTPRNKIRQNERPYLILGSEYYVATEVFEEGDCRGIIVLDENNESVKKNCFLYFAGYNNADDESTFWIPDEMVEFLGKLNPKYNQIINGNRFPRNNEMVIVDMAEYLQ